MVKYNQIEPKLILEVEAMMSNIPVDIGKVKRAIWSRKYCAWE